MLVAGIANLRSVPANPSGAEATTPQVDNPTELRTAVSFGAFYAIVLLLAAVLTQWLGGAGLYAVAAVSGLTDVDAVSLSSMRLFGVGGVTAVQAVAAIALAFLANLGFKFAFARWIGGRALARHSAGGFLASGLALLVAIAVLQGSAVAAG